MCDTLLNSYFIIMAGKPQEGSLKHATREGIIALVGGEWHLPPGFWVDQLEFHLIGTFGLKVTLN